MVNWLSPISPLQGFTLKSFKAAGDGTTDDTSPVQAALNTAGAAGGGFVYAENRTYLTSNLTFPSNVTLVGGGFGTCFKAKPGTTGNYFSLATPSSTIATQAWMFRIDANNQSGLKAVYLDNTGVAQNSLHRWQNLWIYNSVGDSFTLGPAVIETNVNNIFIFNGGANGFVTEVAATDNRIGQVTAGQMVGNGFYNVGNNNHFTDNKAFYCGYNVSGGTWNAGKHGFVFAPAASQDLHAVSIVGCEAQNNSTNGFHFDGSASGATIQHVTITNCQSDGNNEIGATGTSGVGFYFNNVRNSAITANVTRSQSGASHNYGAVFTGNMTGTQIGPNDFNGTTAPVYLDSSVSSNPMSSSAAAYQYSVMPNGAIVALDAPFSGVGRVRSSGSLQTVTDNGPWDAYISNGTTQNNVWSLYYDHMSMHGYGITDLKDPVSAQDAATKNWTDTYKVAELQDVAVTSAPATLVAGKNSGVTAAGTYTAPTPAASVATPPQRFALTNRTTSSVTLSVPNPAGTVLSLTILPGEVITFRQVTTSGYINESGNKPLGQLDARYMQTSIGVGGYIAAGSNVTITGAGTTASPYSIAATGSSGITRSVVTLSGNTAAGSVAQTDYVYICPSGSYTLTLPTAVGNTNRYDFKNNGSGILSIATTFSQTIDQYTDIQLVQYQGISIVSNNSNWVILAS